MKRRGVEKFDRIYLRLLLDDAVYPLTEHETSEIIRIDRLKSDEDLFFAKKPELN
ncbi:MAG: hypothetical protein PHW04_05720 [Candidatus Wallbacteria bacterium]|nr:hypothetical protein [Candidatus Wallbacteria bacterium]